MLYRPLFAFMPAVLRDISSDSEITDFRIRLDPKLVPTKELIRNISFTHFIEFLKCDDPLKRAFYEQNKGTGIEWVSPER